MSASVPQDPRTGAVPALRGGEAGRGEGGRPGSDEDAASMGGGAEREGARVRLERRYRFSASHLYRRPEWSEEENRARFGRCANLPGHGHNYRLFVGVRGTPDPQTAFVVDLGELDALVRRLVLDRLDHQHLNAALPEFGPGRTNPSSEALVGWIRSQLAGTLPAGVELVRVRVEEDEDLAAEWRLEDG